MLLEVQNVGMSFDGAPVLRNVSFSLDRGQSLAVVAPSGAGKSTLLSIVGLILQPTSGRVLFDGVDTAQLTDDERSALRAQHLGFLFQSTQLLGSLRAIENAALPADFVQDRTAALSREAAQERARTLLCELGLEERLYHFPHQLSIGQKRRIATARALFLEPALILADEPTNDLDPANAARVCDALFKRVSAGQAALLYATHDKELAARANAVLELSPFCEPTTSEEIK